MGSDAFPAAGGRQHLGDWLWSAATCRRFEFLGHVESTISIPSPLCRKSNTKWLARRGQRAAGRGKPSTLTEQQGQEQHADAFTWVLNSGARLHGSRWWPGRRAGGCGTSAGIRLVRRVRGAWWPGLAGVGAGDLSWLSVLERIPLGGAMGGAAAAGDFGDRPACRSGGCRRGDGDGLGWLRRCGSRCTARRLGSR